LIASFSDWLAGRTGTFTMNILVATGLTIFFGDFALGYGTRAMISAYNREHARRRWLT
jgi:hypothetical protein